MAVSARLDLRNEKGPDKFRAGRAEEKLMLLVGFDGSARVLLNLWKRIKIESNGRIAFLKSIKRRKRFVGRFGNSISVRMDLVGGMLDQKKQRNILLVLA